MSKLDQKLIKLATEASFNHDKWAQVLEHIMQTLGVPAAMITLRDSKSCQIIDDNDLEKHLHSRFIKGFPKDVAKFYLEHLREIDPWARAQITHYPTRPLVMSSVCCPNDHPDDPFFKWLTELGIVDTIACELMSGYNNWTALNIFIANGAEDNIRTIIEYTSLHQEILRNTWRASRNLIVSAQQNQATLSLLDDIDVAACILDENGVMIDANLKFETILKRGCVKLIGPKRILSIGHEINFNNFKELGKNIARHEVEECPYDAHVKIFDSDPLYSKKRKPLRLVTFKQASNSLRLQFTKRELSALTDIERLMFDAICEGQHVTEAGKSIGYGKTRTYEIWNNVKSKLGISSAHQLR